MVGERIRLLRKQKNITMKELGEILTLGESTISMYENDKRAPDYTTLIKIAENFNTTTDFILCKTDDPMPPSAKKEEHQTGTIYDALEFYDLLKKIGIKNPYNISPKSKENLHKFIENNKDFIFEPADKSE